MKESSNKSFNTHSVVGFNTLLMQVLVVGITRGTRLHKIQKDHEQIDILILMQWPYFGTNYDNDVLLCPFITTISSMINTWRISMSRLHPRSLHHR